MARTKDNNGGESIDKIYEIKERDFENFQKIANVKIRDLKIDDCPNLLVFPHTLDEYGDKIGDSTIFTIENQTLTTGNIMGFIGINNSQLTIGSRFAENDKQDYFLHYMLQKVFSINLFDLKHSTDPDSVFDFLLYLFPYYLNKALRKGLFKNYQKRDYNDANVRGIIDVNQQIRKNIPFNGKIAYQTREHSYNNHITQLIRHTIQFIGQHKLSGNILRNIPETKDNVSQIILATPTYERNKRTTIINQNLKPLNHPYFIEYKSLQKICLQILQYEQLKFGKKKDEIYGVLFDGAWLWEEYLNTILEKEGFKHPENRKKKGAIYVFRKNEGECYRRYPDFYKDNFVLDAKYKNLETNDIGREDMNQVITYMYLLQAKEGAFIYPEKESKKDNPIEIGVLKGYGNIVNLYHLIIPENSKDFKAFTNEIKENEVKMIEKLRK